MPEIFVYVTKEELDSLGINNDEKAGLIIRELLGLPTEFDVVDKPKPDISRVDGGE